MEQTGVINTYYLVNPIIWADNEKKLLKAFLNAAQIGIIAPGKNINFNINPICGWIYFENTRLLWSNHRPYLSKNPEEVKEVCNAFLSRLHKETSTKEFSSQHIPPLIPNNINVRIRPKSIVLVPNPNRRWEDHWLVKFTVLLRGNRLLDEFFEFEGSDIEMRIGQNNQIVGFFSRWRPSYLEKSEDEIVAINMSDNHHNDTSDEEEDLGQFTMIYEGYGENTIQNRILPFYKNVSASHSHHGNYIPACKNSFIIRINEELSLDADNIIHTEFVGGSGNFEYVVYAWKPDEVFDNGCFKIVEGNYQKEHFSFELTKGVYNLLFWVMDVETGIIRKYEHTLYSAPIANSEIFDQPLTA